MAKKLDWISLKMKFRRVSRGLKPQALICTKPLTALNEIKYPLPLSSTSLTNPSLPIPSTVSTPSHIKLPDGFEKQNSSYPLFELHTHFSDSYANDAVGLANRLCTIPNSFCIIDFVTIISHR